MKFDVTNRYTGKVQFTAEIDCAEDAPRSVKLGLAVKWGIESHADLRFADLRYTDLRYTELRSADLRSADLRSADLRSADLRSADLSSADLRSADLRYTDLRSADLRYTDLRYTELRSAKNFNPNITDDLRILLDQPGKIRAYKLVNSKMEGIYNGGLKYEIGAKLEVGGANTDPQEQCGAGINLAALPWCIREWREDYKILLCEFTAKDIACIPHGTDGKFRVHRCEVVGEKDLAEIGLIDAKEQAA